MCMILHDSFSCAEQFLFEKGVSLFYFTLDENDYVQLTRALSFTSAAPTDCIEFLVVRDIDAIELTEDFTISASLGSFNATARIVILNDGKQLRSEYTLCDLCTTLFFAVHSQSFG